MAFFFLLLFLLLQRVLHLFPGYHWLFCVMIMDVVIMHGYIIVAVPRFLVRCTVWYTSSCFHDQLTEKGMLAVECRHLIDSRLEFLLKN